MDGNEEQESGSYRFSEDQTSDDDKNGQGKSFLTNLSKGFKSLFNKGSNKQDDSKGMQEMPEES